MEWEMGLAMGYNNDAQHSLLYGALPTSVDALRVDDLLDFSNHEVFPSMGGGGDGFAVLAPSSAETPCSGFSSQSSSFDIFIPQEEAAELEWLSRFVDDSFSDVPNYQYNINTIPNPSSNIPKSLDNDRSPAPNLNRGSRTKRPRTPTNPISVATSWSSHTSPSPSPSPSPSSSSSEFSQPKPKSNTNTCSSSSSRARRPAGAGGEGVRQCTHCASEKTPQWRTGPLGPKTLCNACGVRYKSGRLVPEYRPAASPTFVLTQHSNSHRKVMELRRQKDMMQSGNGAVRTTPEMMMMYKDYGVC